MNPRINNYNTILKYICTDKSVPAVKVTQPYRVLSTDGTAQIQCVVHPRPSYHQIEPSHDQNTSYPFPDPEELSVTLLKGLHGSQELCSSSINFLQKPNETDVKQEGEVQCSAQATDGAVTVSVSGLKATDTDLYRCEIQIFYPPPYLRFTGNGTLIHSSAADGVPVLALLIVIMCVLVVMIYFQVGTFIHFSFLKIFNKSVDPDYKLHHCQNLITWSLCHF
uniref:Immunoglobulin V-set domain-containing protein n=1 Tax=Amphiprion ocellaris TaxID=80972 RepID=A0A3Q1CTV0_AMPOC